MKLSAVAAVFFVMTLGLAAGADDLETLFDNASGKSAPTGKAAGQVQATSPLRDLLKREIKSPTPDQSLFIQYVEAGDWQKALLQFPVAFERTSFQRSANGRALFALTHFKAGLPVTGLEYLFKNVDDPKQIHPEIRSLWSKAADKDSPAWKLAQIQWRKGFNEIFSPEAEFQVMARNLASAKGEKELLSFYDGFPSNSMAKARAGWQLVITYAVNNKVEEAAKILAQLMKSDVRAVSDDLMQLTAARLLFQRAHYAAAIKYYEKIGKNSEYWTDAQEEMAWSYIRRGEPGNAMAASKSLVSPGIAIQAGPEGYFVYSLSLLKICDYPSVMKALSAFPKSFKERTAVLNRLATTSNAPESKKVIGQLKQGRISRADIGKEGLALPRMVSRDERLFALAQAQQNLESEASVADKIYAKSLAQTGLQGYFDRLRKDLSLRAQTAASESQNRVKELAKTEVEETKEVLRKLHIVEAEVLQQVSIGERLASNSKAKATEQKGTTGSKDKDVLTFPDDNEMWFDEVGNYRVNVKKACHASAKGEG